MLLTMIVLTLAHLATDFVFQSDRMARDKQNPLTLLKHCAYVTVGALGAIGFAGSLVPVLIIATTHLLIDAYKAWVLEEDQGRGRSNGVTYFLASRLGPYPAPIVSFGVDQLAHLGVLYAIARGWPDAYSYGLAALMDETIILNSDVTAAILIGLASLIAIIPMGSIATGMAISKFGDAIKSTDEVEDGGMRGAGTVIGWMERVLVYVLVLSGSFAAVGFIITAKSVLRFGDVRSSERMTSEYVIIGTLISFTWALVVALAAKWALHEASPSLFPPRS